jgi:hypothetical protein
MDEYPVNRSEPDTSVNAGRHIVAYNREAAFYREDRVGRLPTFPDCTFRTTGH